MKIADIGSRSFDDSKLLTETLSEFSPSEIFSGGAIGADQLAASWAKLNGISLKEFLPDYKRYGRSAPIRRNDLIVEAADIVIAFWDGSSRGTKYTIDYATKLKKIIKVVKF
jgi:hypothetical protein